MGNLQGTLETFLPSRLHCEDVFLQAALEIFTVLPVPVFTCLIIGIAERKIKNLFEGECVYFIRSPISSLQICT